MMKYLLVLYCLLSTFYSYGSIIRGRVTDEKGQPLPFATVLIKGTTEGTTTNAAGQYQLEIAEGLHSIVCQFIGYRKEEKQITIIAGVQELNFEMQPVRMQIKEVVIKAGGEDPAYAIIRQAIKKRSFYQQQVNEYTCEAYIKGSFKMKEVPKQFMGQKIDKKEMGVDTSGQGVIFLSESLTKIAFKKPDQLKLEVLSSRQSGGGFGFSFPTFISFYENNVTAVLTQLSPRGYISPIAENALFYYKYRLEGVFYEDGKAVNKIKVIPRRKFEPLFSGYIFITDDDWRIHSTDLLLTQDYQLELMDSLRIRQTHVPVTPEVWRIKDQVVYISFRQFGFNLGGSFVNVYTGYNLHPQFPPKYFDKTIMKYDTAFDKKKVAYWDSIRPVPLEKDEVKDFREKDSTAKANRDSAMSRSHLDTLQKNQKPVKLMDVLWKGASHRYYFSRDSSVSSHLLTMQPLLKRLQYNTVEGLVVNIKPAITFDLPGAQQLRIAPSVRYGFSNTHLNAEMAITYEQNARLGKRSGHNTWTLAGGKRISQFNKAEPIDALTNEVYTLLLKENYMKLYENWFGALQFQRRFQTNDVLKAGLTYENRIPVENTTDFVIFRNDRKMFTPNHPVELAGIPFTRHQALVFDVGFTWQPGQRFIELPNQKMAFGSKYPTFELAYSKGIHGIAGSDVDFDKWSLAVRDRMNLKLWGAFSYRIGAGGFFNDKYAAIPDFQHFNGNQTFYNIKYLNSFQLAPYYQYSTTAPFYATANAEHHFNGLLTNKIPLFNRLKWNLVAGSNAFYVNRDNHYVEVFAGIENILKIIRVDVIAGYQSQADTRVGVRVGFGGLLGGLVRFDR
ncbi:DUF5686 and carboxypeptidase regulatory-like domain-containing protein [Chitinophaga defluvii]|uniref:DUF5686 and carboxypeptidase regulatory-like domain-containing protein n=1 Tax=Chitinophaga defluvii TaxID=3163343 RepID=A0ABV2T4U6_9BACT